MIRTEAKSWQAWASSMSLICSAGTVPTSQCCCKAIWTLSLLDTHGLSVPALYCVPPCFRMGPSLARHLLQLLKVYSSLKTLFTISNVTASLTLKCPIPKQLGLFPPLGLLAGMSCFLVLITLS